MYSSNFCREVEWTYAMRGGGQTLHGPIWGDLSYAMRVKIALNASHDGDCGVPMVSVSTSAGNGKTADRVALFFATLSAFSAMHQRIKEKDALENYVNTDAVIFLWRILHKQHVHFIEFICCRLLLIGNLIVARLQPGYAKKITAIKERDSIETQSREPNEWIHPAERNMHLI